MHAAHTTSGTATRFSIPRAGLNTQYRDVSRDTCIHYKKPPHQRMVKLGRCDENGTRCVVDMPRGRATIRSNNPSYAFHRTGAAVKWSDSVDRMPPSPSHTVPSTKHDP